MADRDIKIGIKTTADTSGAKAAEESLDKIGDASREVAEVEKAAAAEHAEAMAKARKAADELFEGLENIEDGLKDVAEAGQEANEEGSELDENVKSISRAQKAQAIAQLASEVGKIAGKFREAADEVEEFDKEAAASMRATADRIELVTGSVSALALGFAAGGALGAAVAGLALSIGAVVNAFKESEVAAIRASASQTEAIRKVDEATRAALASETERQTTLTSGKVIGTLSRELTELGKISVELERQLKTVREKRRLENEVLQAEDRANLAEVDRAEAGGEITSKQAADKRSEIESAAGKRSRDDRKRNAIEDAVLAAENAKVKIAAQEKAQAAFDDLRKKQSDADEKASALSDYAEGEMGKMVPDQKTGELSESDRKFTNDMAREIETARLTLTALQTATEEARSTLETARSEAAEAIRNVSDRTSGAGSVVSAVDRIGAAENRSGAAKSDLRNIQETNRKKREEDAAADRAQREEEKAIEREGKGIPGRVGDATRGAKDSSVTRNVRAATEKLKDGATASEYSGLGAALDEFVTAAQSMKAEGKAEVRALAKTVNNLADRLRRVEGK